jgi:hypothetical protein
MLTTDMAADNNGRMLSNVVSALLVNIGSNALMENTAISYGEPCH